MFCYLPPYVFLSFHTVTHAAAFGDNNDNDNDNFDVRYPFVLFSKP
jgi:hypothetical protein